MQIIQHFGDHRIGFGVDGTGIQRLFAAVDAQEAGGLLISFIAEARHFQQFAAAVERAVFIAVGNDVLRQRAVEAGNTRQQRGGSGVHVHTDGIHAIFHHRIQ